MARQCSNLDLALEAEHPLGLAVLGDMAEALSQSELPYKVDVVDCRAVDDAFRSRIEQDMATLAY